MNWNEDTWEDVTGPLSPYLETAPVSANFFDYPAQTKAIQNGHVGNEETGRGQTSNSSVNLNSKSKREPSDDSSMDNLTWELLGSHGWDTSQKKNGKKMRHNKDNPEIRHDLSKNRTSNAAELSSTTGLSSQKSSINLNVDSKSRTMHFNNVTSVRPSARPSTNYKYDSVEVKHQRIDIPPQVPQPVCNNQTSVEQKHHQKAMLKMSPTSDDSEFLQELELSSEKSENYSKLNTRNDKPSRGETLHEYEKQKNGSKDSMQGRYSSNNDDYDSDSYKDNKTNIDDDDDRVNAIICMVFCVMGVGVVFGLIFILVHYTEHRNQREMEKMGENDDYIEFTNSIYYHRVASIIQSVSIKDQEKWHHRSRSFAQMDDVVEQQELCQIHPPILCE